VVREAEDRDVRIGVGDLARVDAGDVRDHELRLVGAVGRDEMVAREKRLELAAEEEVDPTEQDRGHETERNTVRGRVPGGPNRQDSGTHARARPRYAELGRRTEVPSASAGSDEIAERLASGLGLIAAGRYFEAHEELELAWRAAREEERDFFQGLVHVAVAWYQAGRGNRTGCERQLAKAQRRLEAYAPTHRDLDLASILAQLDDAARTVHAGSLELPAVRLSRISSSDARDRSAEGAHPGRHDAPPR
jgi:predicted metal-dependent hydrolase